MMIPQGDLFAPAFPAGLAFAPDVIGREEEAALIALFERIELAPFRFQGWTGKRRTASFGWRYDFDDASFAPTTPIPTPVLPLRAAAARLAGLAADDLVQMLLTRYDPGAGIGWHRDRPVFDHVVGVSLGAPAVLRLRRRTQSGFDRRALSLPPRSAYHLAGEARYGWEHSIAPIDATRWSITFRSLSDNGRIAGGQAAR